MALATRAAELLGIEETERRSVTLMLAHSFAMGLSTVLFETAASALFLARFGSPLLPWMYITAAVLNTATGIVYSAVQQRVSFERLMGGTLVFLIATVCLLRTGLFFTDAAWLVFALLVWYRALSALTDLEYWAVATRLYDVRQAKRLFGLIGSGEVVARIAGAFSVPLLVRFGGVPNLIWLSALALLGCLAALLPVLRQAQGAATSTSGAGPKRDATGLRQFTRLFANRYLLLLFSIAFFGVLAKYFVDYAFLGQVKARYADAGDVAAFFGLFSGVSQVLSLLTRLFISGPLISRHGIRFGLLVLPIAHALCTGLVILDGTLFKEVGILFWLIIANQGLYKTLKHPLDNPSFKVLYQPLRAEQRLAAQIAVETMVTPITTGLAGGIMLLFTVVIPYSPVRFACVMLAAFGAWVAVAQGAGRAYADALTRALRGRFGHDGTFSFDDERSRAVLAEALESPEPVQVLFALDVLERSDHERLGPSLLRLLDHPSSEVRLSVLQRVERRRPPGALSRLQASLRDDRDATERAAAIRAVGSLAGPDAVPTLVPLADLREPEVRRAALATLLRHGGDAGDVFARPRLLALARSPSALERSAAAQVLGDAARDDLAAPLVDLLRDPDAAVRSAALASAGRLRPNAAWPLAVEALGDRRVAGPAASALAAGGDAALPALETSFGRQTSARTLVLIARVCGRIRGDRATALLLDHLGHPHATVRTEVLEALRTCSYRAEGDGAARVAERITVEAADAAWKLFARRDLGGAPLLAEALDREIAESRRRLFLLLAFVHDPKAILRARDNLAHPSKDKRAYASEVLDVTLARDTKGGLLPILEDLPLAERCRRLTGEAGETTRSPKDRVLEILDRSEEWITPWTRSCAARAAVAIGAGDGPWEGTLDMLTIERILTLKSVDMFARTSEDVLAQIAGVLEEAEVPKGRVIFEKGDLGNSLYIVIEGRVRVYDGDTVIGTLGEKDIFGELALLDPEPRFASIAAETDVRLFRLDREAFSELMAGNIEIVRGVLHVLCQRLRQETSEHVPPAAGPGVP